jgi:hypothetical protein
MAVDVERLIECRGKPLCQLGSRGSRPRIGEYNKLVAVPSPDDIGRLQYGRKTPRAGVEYGIADCVAKGVVDVAKCVQIQEENRGTEPC